MPDAATQDPSQDQDFLKASPEDQHAYLMHVDKDYAAAVPRDQRGYLADVTGQSHVSPKPTAPGGGATGAYQTDPGQPVRNAGNSTDLLADTVHRIQFRPAAVDLARQALQSYIERSDQSALEEAGRTGKAPEGQVWRTWGPRALKTALDYAKGFSEPKNLAMTAGAMAAPEVAGPVMATEGIAQAIQHAKGAFAGKPDDLEAMLTGGATAAGGGALARVAAVGTAGGAPVKTPVADLLQKTGRMIKGEPPQMLVPEAQKAMTQAIQPGVNIPKAQESIAIAGPRMQQIRESLPEDALGKNIRSGEAGPATLQALELNKVAKQQILAAIQERIGPVKDLQPDTSPIADAMEKSISKRTATQFPETAARIKARAATYRDSGLTLGDVESSIQDANKSLRNFYKQPTAGENPTSADMDATLAEVKELRSLLDKKVGELGGNGEGDLADLKREYGAQRDIEKALARQHAVATRVKGGGLWEGLAYLQAAGEALSGNPLAMVKAGGAIAVGKMLKNLRSPDFLLEQSFHGPKAFQAAEPIAPSAGPPKPAGLLRAPATQLPGPADTSGQARDPSARWATPAAALPAPGAAQPIDAKFIREIPRAQPPAPDRTAPKALLPEETPETRAQRTTTIPPAVSAEHAREAIGRFQDANKLGDAGQGGVRTTGQAQLPGPGQTMPEERARLLMQQTLDVMRSADRPRRYFDESEQGDVRTGPRQIKGGDWRGVPSTRTMLPWAQENKFTPQQMEAALKAYDKGRITKAMQSAIDFVKRESQGAAGRAESQAKAERLAEAIFRARAGSGQ